MTEPLDIPITKMEPPVICERTIFHVGISGGKDSAAVLLWMIHESGIPREKIRATFCDIKNDHDCTIAHVQLLSETVFLVAFGGSDTRGPIEVATAVRAKGGSGHMDFESETFARDAAPTLDANYAKLQGASRQDINHGCGHLVAVNTGQGFYSESDAAGAITSGPRSQHEGTLIAFDTTQITNPDNRSNPQPGDPSGPLTATGHPPTIAFQTRGSNVDVGEVSGTIGSNADRASGSAPCVAFRAAGQDGFTPDNISPPITGTRGGGADVPTIAFQDRIRGDDGRGYDRPMPTSEEVTGALETVKPWHVATVADPISAHEASTYTHEGRENFRVRNVAPYPVAVRRLTPLECERLQGFPDHYTFIPSAAGQRLTADIMAYLVSHHPTLTWEEAERIAADGPRYTALGNSMAINCMSWIGQRIQQLYRL